MTHNEHREFCDDICKSFGLEMKVQVGEFKQTMLEQFVDFKRWMNLYVENTILKEMRENGNNRKIAPKRKR